MVDRLIGQLGRQSRDQPHSLQPDRRLQVRSRSIQALRDRAGKLRHLIRRQASDQARGHSVSIRIFCVQLKPPEKNRVRVAPGRHRSIGERPNALPRCVAYRSISHGEWLTSIPRLARRSRLHSWRSSCQTCSTATVRHHSDVDRLRKHRIWYTGEYGIVHHVCMETRDGEVWPSMPRGCKRGIRQESVTRCTSWVIQCDETDQQSRDGVW